MGTMIFNAIEDPLPAFPPIAGMRRPSAIEPDIRAIAARRQSVAFMWNGCVLAFCSAPAVVKAAKRIEDR